MIPSASQPVLVKRYAGTRLYDTASARYVSVDELRRWAADGVTFQVCDANTQEDVTRILLA